jgi:Dolichyl-phosphate-mannose-protein mannosyltransferase
MSLTKSKPSFPFWILALSIVFGCTLPILIQEGMFQDAMLYSSVSHNLGIGIGTFWHPQYSTLNIEGIPSFHEQPPLVFGIQAVLYRIFGDSIYIERWYTFAMILMHIALINILWKSIFKDNIAYKNLGWLPVIFWIIIPVCFWSFHNNMIENTVSIFTLCSIIISYTIIQSEKYNIGLWVLSGFFIFLASFSKGVPGLFPITFPFLYWVITQKISFQKCMLYSFVLVAIPAIIYGVFLLNPESKHSLSIYFFDRLIRRVNTMPTVTYRLETVWRLFTELIPVFIIVLITYFVSDKTKRQSRIVENKNEFLLFLMIGLSSSLPLTLTMVQKGWYMVPGFPFFAIAFAILIVPNIANVVNRIDTQGTKYRVFGYVSVLLLAMVLTITFMQKDKISREQDTVTDVYKIGKIVPKFSTITVPAAMYDQYDFVLQGFLVRYFNISISPLKEYVYFMKEKQMPLTHPTRLEKIEIGLTKYDLYKYIK